MSEGLGRRAFLRGALAGVMTTGAEKATQAQISNPEPKRDASKVNPEKDTIRTEPYSLKFVQDWRRNACTTNLSKDELDRCFLDFLSLDTLRGLGQSPDEVREFIAGLEKDYPNTKP